MWGGFGRGANSLEATASALVAAAEHLASQARAARAAAASARVAAMGIDTASCTTVMLRNLPKNLTQVAVLQTLENHGFSALYDFVYLPVDFQKMVSFGYAVVNFVTHEAAERAMQYFTGFTEWPMPSRKACTTVWNTPCQGLAAHIERYRDSPLMHPSVAPEFKPMLFSHGTPVVFPPPTKQLKAPPRLPQNAPSKVQARVARKNTSKTF
jgi:RNA recognition motif-containing protein